MSESLARIPEELARQVWETENEYEEGLREAFLADRLFHIAYLITGIHEEISQDDLQMLKEEFLREKKGLNMGQVFALAISDRFRFKLHVVELGRSTHPSNTGEIDALKGEYNDFIDWISRQDPEDIYMEEISRQDSGRYVHYRPPKLEAAQNQVMVLTRNRPLMKGVMRYDNAPINIAIGKRMIFSIPIATFTALRPEDGKLSGLFTEEQTLELIETMLQNGSGGVKPIRTAYYLFTDQG